jgi:hypothetical protein
MAKRPYDVQVLTASDDLDAWDAFVDTSPQGSVYCRPWWLQAVCGDEFGILTLRDGSGIVAGMPFRHVRRWIFRHALMPPLTQVLGVLLAPSKKTSYEGRLSEETNVLSAVVEAMPRFDICHLRCHYNFTNWLPFHWAGFTQTTRYTYVIPDLTDLEKVYSEFAHSKRKNVRKAEGLVEVHEDLPADALYANHVLTLSKQGQRIAYEQDTLERIVRAADAHESGKSFYALDADANMHAAILVVFDRHSAYYVISSIDPDFRNSGAATLLVRDAIAYASRHTSRFDFEGSMIPGVEQSFRKFGARQTPYFVLRRDSRPLPRKLLGAACTVGRRILGKRGP